MTAARGSPRKRKHARRFLFSVSRKEERRIEFLGTAAIGAFSFLIMCVFVLSSAQRFFLKSPQVAAVVSAILVDLANGERAQSDLQTLKISPILAAVAQAKANDMATKEYFAHVSPEGVDPWFWFKQAGYSFEYAGENLAVDFSDSGDVNMAWMNSPTHRENILDPHYTQIGIATAQGMYQGRLTTFVVQEFGTPTKETAAPKSTAVSTIPENPTEVAVAHTEKVASNTPAPTVLGASADSAPPVSASKVIATTAPAVAASLAQKSKDTGIPLWGYLVGFPRTAMHYAYYLLGLLVLAALGIDTGLELHWHHRKHVMRAGIALAVIAAFFVLADALFFAKPILALIAASL